ncbi:hypothetical protein E2562_018691 [Oryza meyeriana var. granulata]|uniref:Uncharacterized protein n=1 Tax=Oryza meyeriana var. granulata TaxID=110450 RepID=A0A6G1EMN9_9ORYZ|nr:hypothetical protein E2562_018691 [Oryza meyeriana var. granulata]
MTGGLSLELLCTISNPPIDLCDGAPWPGSGAVEGRAGPGLAKRSKKAATRAGAWHDSRSKHWKKAGFREGGVKFDPV